MNSNIIIDVLDSLQNFIALKQQNNIIYFWMAFKKNHRKFSLNHSKITSQNCSFKSLKEERPDSPYNISNFQFYNNIKKPSIQKTNQRNYRFPDKFNDWQYDQMLLNYHKPISTLKPFVQGKQRKDLIEGKSRIYCSSHIQQFQLDDSDQFQDIVLDRLSKLEQNINKLMGTKKIKEHTFRIEQTYRNGIELIRGNVHLDINQNERMQVKDPQINDNDIRNRKKKFFNSLQNSGQEMLKNRDMIYNLKYIPTINNTKEIEKTMKSKAKDEAKNEAKDEAKDEQNGEGEDIIENIQFFNEINLRQFQRAIKQKQNHWDRQLDSSNQLEINNSNPSSQTHLGAFFPKNKGSSVLQMNRQGASQTARNNRIHYITHDIQMQTVAECRKKYNRNNNYIIQMDNDHAFSQMYNSSSDVGQNNFKEQHESLIDYCTEYSSLKKQQLYYLLLKD